MVRANSCGVLNILPEAFETKVDGMNVEKVGDDDTNPFFDARVPVISLHSINPQTFESLPSKKDQLEAIGVGGIRGFVQIDRAFPGLP